VGGIQTWRRWSLIFLTGGHIFRPPISYKVILLNMGGEVMNKPNIDKESMTRRKFLITAGTLTTGLIATGITGCGAKGQESERSTQGKEQDFGTAPSLPWKYHKLDVDRVRKRGYEGYYKYGCCYGAAEALLTTISETSGGPWSTIPIDMFKWGAGGGLSWGTLCGALNGAMYVINLASEKFAEIGNELIGWYTLFPFPSDKHETYCKITNQAITVANSPLCHISVSTWADVANARVNEEGKKERCAKVTGDTAAYAAQLLNRALDGKVVALYQPPKEFSHCLYCHQGPNSLEDDEQGKFNCLSCHEDHSFKNKK